MTNYDGKFPASRLVALHHYCRRSSVVDRTFVTNKPQNKKNRNLLDKVLIRPEEAYAKWALLLDENFAHDYLHNVVASDAGKKRVGHFFSTILHKQNKERLLIKTTGPTRMDHLSSLFPDACFIHVKRDACAVINSIVKTDFWQDSMDSPRWSNGLADSWPEEWERYNLHPMALVAMQYKAIMDICQSEQSRLGEGRYLEITYQEFIADPMSTMNRVLDYVGLSASDEVNRYINAPGRYQNMDNKYESELSSNEISMIRQIVGHAS